MWILLSGFLTPKSEISENVNQRRIESRRLIPIFNETPSCQYNEGLGNLTRIVNYNYIFELI